MNRICEDSYSQFGAITAINRPNQKELKQPFLTRAGVLVLYDDRTDVRAGEKFVGANLIALVNIDN